MSVIIAPIGNIILEHEVGDAGALNWRWWRRSLIELGYQDERCVSLGYVDDPAGFVLIAYERDATFDLCSPFSLFPIVNDAEALPGAAEFAERIVAQSAKEPMLL
jgi:hypothetical protein